MNRKIIFPALLSLLCLPLFSQARYPDRSNPELYRALRTNCRTEITIPDVDGFKAVKTDLHCHTVCSDAAITPEYRVREAWLNGLDVLAITDHIEYVPGSRKMAKYIYADGAEKVDFNYPCDLAAKEAKKYGISIIRGLEITRDPQEIGHFCVLFTKDNNSIPDKDPLVSMQNAIKQGALIQINHPGWHRTDCNLTAVAEKAIKAGYISGVEAFNGIEFYPKSIKYALDHSLFLAANTDSHEPVAGDYMVHGQFRNMTIIFAKDTSEASLIEALRAGRTVAYSFGDMAGREDILVKLFDASVSYSKMGTDKKGRTTYHITNHSSLPFIIQLKDSGSAVEIPAFSTVSVRTNKGCSFAFSIENMWCGPDKHPFVEPSVANCL